MKLALFTVLAVLLFAGIGLAGEESTKVQPKDGMAFYITVITIGFALAFAAIAGAMSQAKAITASVESIARQPEAGGRIFLAMIIGLALIETLVIYTLVICFMLIGKIA